MFKIIKKLTLSLIALATLIGLAVPTLVLATPTAGDYQTRQESIWSKDVIANSLGGFTQRLCVLAKLKPEDNVGQDIYAAKANFSACAPGAVASPSDTWDLFTVKSIVNPDVPTSYIMKAWLTGSEKNGVITNFTNLTYFKYTVTSSTDYKLESCAAASFSASNCIRKTFITLKDSLVEIHNNKSSTSQTLGALGSYFHLSAYVTSDTGYGSVKSSNLSASSSSVSGKFKTDMDLDYAYTGNDAVLSINNFKMGDPNQPLWDVIANGQSCIDRQVSKSKKTVFSYEIYRADGSQYVINNPQIPFRIIDANNQFISDGNGGNLGGRIMWDNWLNQTSLFFPTGTSTIVQKLNAGEILQAQTWLGGFPNYNLPIRIDPNDPTKFQVLDKNANPYIQTAPLEFTFTVNDGVNVSGLLLPNLNGSVQSLSYQGNGYIHSIPWDSVNGPGYVINKGTEVIGVKDGLSYFVRPMFYSIEPSAVVCPTNANQMILNTQVTRARLPSASSFTGDISSLWSDPRLFIGASPTLSNKSYKYIDGVKQ